LSIAAVNTASRGERARVETLVAIELAVSWKPFVKSKKSATATTVTRVRSSKLPRAYAFLTSTFPTTFAAVSQASSATRKARGSARPTSSAACTTMRRAM